MTPYEEYEQVLKEHDKEIKKQIKEQKKKNKKHLKDLMQEKRKINSELYKSRKIMKRDKEEVKHEYGSGICIQLDYNKALKEYNDRRKMDFANCSIIELLHKPK